MHCFVKNIQNIPEITKPTVNSLIEAMRGCGRGCDFCDVNKRSKKDLSIERLQREAKVNLDYGFDSVWLHSDEMLLYGCDNKDFIPNRDAITDLWKGLKGMGANFIGTTHMTFSAVAADPQLMRNIADVNRQHETGDQSSKVHRSKVVHHINCKLTVIRCLIWPSDNYCCSWEPMIII